MASKIRKQLAACVKSGNPLYHRNLNYQYDSHSDNDSHSDSDSDHNSLEFDYDIDGDYVFKNRKRYQLKKALHTSVFFTDSFSKPSNTSYFESLNAKEMRKSRNIVVMILLAGYLKNEDSIITMLPIEILRIIINYIEGLSAKHYRLFIEEKQNQQKYLKNRPSNGFTSKYVSGGIILCKPT